MYWILPILFIILIIALTKPIQESFSPNNINKIHKDSTHFKQTQNQPPPYKINVPIILLGDSILANEFYVDKGSSVYDILKNKYHNTLTFAKDNATIQDITYQFNSLPKNIINKKNIIIIISIGANDILKNYSALQLHSDSISPVENASDLKIIFNKYSKSINYIRTKCNCKIILCNIYYPLSIHFVKYYHLIDIWNKKLRNYAYINNLEIIELDDQFIDKNDFTNDVEPSHKGSLIIVENIIQKI